MKRGLFVMFLRDDISFGPRPSKLERKINFFSNCYIRIGAEVVFDSRSIGAY